jgi:hypothetical protein
MTAINQNSEKQSQSREEVSGAKVATFYALFIIALAIMNRFCEVSPNWDPKQMHNIQELIIGNGF